MSKTKRVDGPKRRGQTAKAQSAAGLVEVARATSRLWRKHHLSYDQSKYVVERARPAQACGRFDLKSGADLEGEFARFTLDLRVNEAVHTTARQGFRDRLDAILSLNFSQVFKLVRTKYVITYTEDVML